MKMHKYYINPIMLRLSLFCKTQFEMCAVLLGEVRSLPSYSYPRLNGWTVWRRYCVQAVSLMFRVIAINLKYAFWCIKAGSEFVCITNKCYLMSVSCLFKDSCRI